METFNAGFEAIERQDCAESAFLQQLATALAAEGALDSCTTNQSISRVNRPSPSESTKSLRRTRLV